MWVACTAREHTHAHRRTHLQTLIDFTSPVCHRTQARRPWESRLNLSLHLWNYQHGYLDHGLFTSQRMLIFRSNSYNWWIKHQELAFNNAVQALSLKEPFRMKTTLKYRQLRPLIFLSFLLPSSSPSFSSSCFLQVSTGRVWRIRPPQWIIPTCRRRDGGWDGTRTARPSAPSPRCRWELSPLTSRDGVVLNIFGFSKVKLLHFIIKPFSFSRLLRKEKLTDKGDSLWRQRLLTAAFNQVSKETHTHTHIHHTHTHRAMHLDHHWKQMSSSVRPLYSSPHKNSSTCITTGWPLWFKHTLRNNIHILMTPRQAFPGGDIGHWTEKKLKRKTTRGRLMKDLHSLVASGADDMT